MVRNDANKLWFNAQGIHKRRYKGKLIFTVHAYKGLFESSKFLKDFNRISGQRIRTRAKFAEFMDNKFNKLKKETRLKLIKLMEDYEWYNSY